MDSRDAIEIRVEGVEEARAALEQIIRQSRDAIPQALGVIGQQWTTEIQRLAPELTGRLRRSYTWEVGRRGAYVEVSSNVLYAPFQEFGTRYISGRPHVRPGTERVIPQVPKLITEGVARSRGGISASAFIGRGGGGRGSLGRTISQLGALG